MLLLCLLSLTLLIPAFAQTPDAPTIARTAATELAQGKFAELYARFTPQMKGALTEAVLRDTLAKQLFATAGAFERIDGDPACQAAQGVQACDLALLFEQARIRLRFAVDGEGRIAGLFALGREARGATQASLFVPAGTLELPAYLEVPKTAGLHPLIVLVHGSGPNDADETIGPNKPFRDLAEGLAARGIATLRYDKRTRVSATPPVTNFEDETIDDALSALKLARTQPGVDPKRVFLLGHSLGGYLAPHIASRDAALRGVILMAGNNRAARDLVLDQVRTITGSEVSFEQAFQSLPKHYRDGLPNYDAPAIAKGLKAPILVLQGARDYQVTTKDFDRWKAALGERKDATFHLYPALNHLFLAGQGAPGPAEYGVASHIPAQVLDDIASWVTAQK